MNKNNRHPVDGKKPVTIFGPDFPFAFDDWIEHPAGLGTIPAHKLGAEVAIVGAGIAGLVAAYELMKLGLKPVVYEASKMGGRLRSQAFEGAEGIIAELIPQVIRSFPWPKSQRCRRHRCASALPPKRATSPNTRKKNASPRRFR